jgi:tetratricopeptide (TPR) repeat protein
LRLCAFLSPDAIPEEIVVAGMSRLALSEKHHKQPEKQGWLPVFLKRTRESISQQEKAFVLDDAIMVICAYSLLSRDPHTHTLSVHRLVQAVQRESMTAEEKKLWKQRVVQAVNTSYPNVQEVSQWNACERWLPHALACATWIEQESINMADAADLLNRTGYYLHDRARYAEAEPLYQRALSIREQQLGPDHPQTAGSLNNLATLYQAQGKYEQAEPLFQRALSISEQQLGAQHPNTATSLNNLALLYHNQGKYEQAEPLYLRALAISEQQLGPQHPDTAQSLNNLAELYRAQGQYAQTEPLLVRALQIREQQLGPQHPDTASSLNNLAALYRAQGQYEQAEPLLKRALSIDEHTLGPQHPDTQTIRANHADLLRTMGHD